MLKQIVFFESSAPRSRLERERSRILTQILVAGTVVSGTVFLLVPLWRDERGIHLSGYGLTFLLHIFHLALVRSGGALLTAKSFNCGGIRGLGGFVYPLVVLPCAFFVTR